MARVALLCVASICTYGCATPFDLKGDKNYACLSRTVLPQGLERCLGTYDVEYVYGNGIHPKYRAKQGDLFQVNDQSFKISYTPSVRDFYRPQQDANLCYAAALSSAFASYGFEYDQSQFRAAIGHECFGVGEHPLTFSQMLFSATRVHLASGGVWYVDTENGAFSSEMNRQFGNGYVPSNSMSSLQHITFCQSGDSDERRWSWARINWSFQQWLQTKLFGGFAFLASSSPIDTQTTQTPSQVAQFDLYRPILWRNITTPIAEQGGIVPIRHSGDLINRFEQGVPILVGLSGGNFGHVVTIHRMKYESMRPEYMKINWFARNAYIEWVEVVDPESPDAPLIKYTGDDFMAAARFIVAVYEPNRRSAR